MAESLFRFSVIRPPLTPDPRYPPIDLAQQTEFQVGLARAVAANPNDPRTGLNTAAQSYVAGASFTPVDASDVNNAHLDAAAKALDALGVKQDSSTGASSTAPSHSSIEDLGSTQIDHGGLVNALTTALGAAPTDFLHEAWLDPLEARMKDSIIALRQLGFEDVTGTLSILARRLRAIEVVRKVVADNSFPVDNQDYQKWRLRSIVVPTFAELQSILSTADAQVAAAKALAEQVARDQDIINALFKTRNDLMNAKQSIIKLPVIHRVDNPPQAWTPIAPPASLSHISLLNQHIELLGKFSDLALNQLAPASRPIITVPPRIPEHLEEATTTTATTAPTPAVQTADLAPLVDLSKFLLTSLAQVPAQPTTAGWTPPTSTPYALKETAFRELPPTTLDVIKQNGLDITSNPIDLTVNQLDGLLKTNATALDNAYAPYTTSVAKIQRFGNLTVQYPPRPGSRWQMAFGLGQKAPSILLNNFSNLIPRPAGRVTILGVTDLLVVKQQLIGYQGGDVAYIENVLKGESRTRELVNKQTVETDTLLETETTETKETDTSQAERFEMSNESDKVIKDDSSMKAGVSVSASYGPYVKVNASYNAASDSSQNTSTKSANTYSKEVTTKASDKLQQRVLQRTTTKTINETTEKENHTFNNVGGAGNISGVYQWQNKVYEAQTWCYGKRTMLEFMIPEPAAFLFDKASNPDQTTGDAVTAVPAFTDSPEQLTPDKATSWAVQYGVTDLTDPPQAMQRVSASFAASANEPQAKADVLSIPAGYWVTGISATASGVATAGKTSNWVVICCGNFTWPWSPAVGVIGTITSTTKLLGITVDSSSTPIIAQTSQGAASGQELITTQDQGQVPWSVLGAYMDSFTATIELFLEATPEATASWQRATWSKLKAKADQLMDAQQVAVAKAKFNATIQGRNPAVNQVVIRNEIKKSCISVMTNQHFEGFGAIQTITTPPAGGLDSVSVSEIDVNKAWAQGPFVRFFEEAFEWEEATWLLYPYFWGRKDDWFRKMEYQDDDPDFEQFMQAGSANVNVPVRPGFEGALDHYLSTGQVWNGGPLPGISSGDFLPLSTEIQESLGMPSDDATKYGPPWPVVVPTNLVKLRKDDMTPSWKLDANGVWVDQGS